MKTEVLVRAPATYTMTGQRLPFQLLDTDESISPGLSKRLHKYALSRFSEAGFTKAVADWDVIVYSIDGDEKLSDRSYCVRFQNSDGGYIELIEIITKCGWPSIDHGYAIGCE